MRRVESRLDVGVSRRREDVRAGGELMDDWSRIGRPARGSTGCETKNVSIASTQKGFKVKALRYIEESRLGLRIVKSGRQRSAIASGSALSIGFMADESPTFGEE